MENYNEEIIKASKTTAVLKCCIILLIIAMLVSMAADKSIMNTLKELINA
jgi:hypothetical protein